jgi:hypothetical protein
MPNEWFDSPATFKRDTWWKVSFIILCLADLALTTLAISLGFSEMNPVVVFLINMPVLLLVVKLGIPVLLAWLIPGKLLLPSVVLLGLVFLWNVKELAFFLAG